VPGRPRDETGFRAAASAAGATVRRPPGGGGASQGRLRAAVFLVFSAPWAFLACPAAACIARHRAARDLPPGFPGVRPAGPPRGALPMAVVAGPRRASGGV